MLWNPYMPRNPAKTYFQLSQVNPLSGHYLTLNTQKLTKMVLSRGSYYAFADGKLQHLNFDHAVLFVVVCR